MDAIRLDTSHSLVGTAPDAAQNFGGGNRARKTSGAPAPGDAALSTVAGSHTITVTISNLERIRRANDTGNVKCGDADCEWRNYYPLRLNTDIASVKERRQRKAGISSTILQRGTHVMSLEETYNGHTIRIEAERAPAAERVRTLPSVGRALPSRYIQIDDRQVDVIEMEPGKFSTSYLPYTSYESVWDLAKAVIDKTEEFRPPRGDLK